MYLHREISGCAVRMRMDIGATACLAQTNEALAQSRERVVMLSGEERFKEIPRELARALEEIARREPAGCCPICLRLDIRQRE